MQKSLYLFLIFISFNAFSQKKTEVFNSLQLEGERQYSVILPPSYNFTKDKTYPVIYVLDAEYLLDTFNGTLQYGYYFDDLPEVILVGIHQENTRIIDSKADNEGLPSEKSGKFFEFLTMELIPYIDKNYRTTSYKAIAGHETTAGFLNFFLYKENPIFNSYISISPLFAKDMENRISERLKSISKPINYIQVSASLDDKTIFDKVQSLNENIKNISKASFSYKYFEIDGYAHFAIVPVAIPQVLYHIFKGYQPISKEEFKELQKQESGFTNYLTEKYKKINDNLGI
ncbi:MAG TPA: histidine kinase, partial [Flavobacterium sp.]|nr:histidine kinase [Flavobacterium sp.]